MSISQRELFTQIPSKSYADPDLSVSNLTKIWTSISQFINESLLTRKAVNIADLGLFTFTQDRNKLQPTFLLASNFQRAYNAKQTQKPTSVYANSTVIQINHTIVASESGLSRDQTTNALKSIVRCAGEAVKGGIKVSFEFTVNFKSKPVSKGKGFSKITISSDSVAIKFEPQLLSKLSLLSPSNKRASSSGSVNIASSPYLSAKRSTSATSQSHPPNILSLHTIELARPEAPVAKFRSSKIKPQSPGQHSKHKSLTILTEELCEFCRDREEKLLNKNISRDEEMLMERQLAELTLIESKKLMSIDEQRSAKQREKRNEIDKFNASLIKPKMLVTSIPSAETLKEEKDYYGYLLEDSKPKKEDNKEYQRSLLAQMEEKKRIIEREKGVTKKMELELLNESLSEHQKLLMESIDQKRRKQQENREYLLDQMATKQVPLAQLGVSEVQFMSHRLLSTAERKVKQKSSAKDRMSDQMEVIQDKQKLREQEREEERKLRELQNQQNEAEKKQEQEELAARKNKTKLDLSNSLNSQIEETQKAREQSRLSRRDANPYLPIGEKHQTHHSSCKRCGNGIASPLKYGRGKFLE